jgi:hypothetical protein
MSSGIRSRRVDSNWPNLTKIGPEVFQGQAQAHRARRRQVAPEHQALHGDQQPRPEPEFEFVVEDQLVEPVGIGNAGDADEAEDAHGGLGR